MFFQILFAQNPKKWIIEVDSLPSNKSLTNILSTQNIENDSIFFIKAQELKEKFTKLGYFNIEMNHIFNDTIYTTQIILHDKIDKIKIQYTDIVQFSDFFQANILDENHLEIPIEQTTDFLNHISNYYQNNGFPFVKVHLENISQNEKTLNANLIVEQGNSYKLDQIIVKGYENFPKKFIKYKLQLTENQLFDKKKIQQISTLLKSLSFVSEIKKPEVLFTQDTTYIYLYLQREKSNKIDGIIGFSNSEKSKGIKLNGYLDLNLQNAFNEGEEFSLNWISDGNQSQTLKLGSEFSYVFNSPFGLQYEMDMYKKDTTFFNFSNSINVNYFINHQHKLAFEWSNVSSNLINNQPLANTTQFSSNFYGISYKFNVPNDSKLFPIKLELITNGMKGKRSQMNQYKLEAELLFVFQVNPKNYFSVKNETSLLFSDQYLDNELYRLGGINSIRGFRENSLIARKFSYLNMGYHFLSDQNSYLSLLTDIGVLKQTKINYIYSIGLGYRMATANGLFTINYFIGNNTNTSFSFKNSFLQFNLSQFF